MLEAAGLECVRQQRVLFSGLGFSLAAGELLRIAGPNGSGKTSLLRILCGLLSPTAGESRPQSLLRILCGLLSPTAGDVRWRGRPIRALREDYARELVYLGHAPAVKDDLSPAENLAIACALAGLPASRAAIAQSLERFGLSASGVPVKRLSQGQRRRAALARLPLCEALPLWLLDEPLTALDAEGADLLRSLIEAHAARGGSVAFTTHQEAGIAGARVVHLASKEP